MRKIFLNFTFGVFLLIITLKAMGCSEVSSDRMCKFRYYVRNYGREKIIDLDAVIMLLTGSMQKRDGTLPARGYRNIRLD